jgi:hypothetical protein
MRGVLQGQRAVRDMGPTSENDVWQWSMAEKVGSRCPLTHDVYPTLESGMRQRHSQKGGIVRFGSGAI